MTENHSQSSDQYCISLFSLLNDCSVEERLAEFEEWVDSVRDPAKERAEGVRRISVDRGRLIAEYNIAELRDGRWAVRVRCDSRDGGVSCPWSEMPTRQDCLDFFLNIARRHFSDERGQRDRSDADIRARQKMQQRLSESGLFGFVEPPVST